MKLVLRGQSYDLAEAVSAATVQTLKVLSVASARSGGEKFEPVTVGSIVESLGRLGADVDPVTLFGDPVFLSNFQGLLFLARRKANEEVTFDECGDFAPSELTFEYEDDEADAGPKDQSAL